MPALASKMHINSGVGLMSLQSRKTRSAKRVKSKQEIPVGGRETALFAKNSPLPCPRHP